MANTTAIRTVLIGCGGMSRAWLDVATRLPDVEIVGLVDIIEEAARKRAADYNLQDAIIGTNVEAVLAQTNADAVFNCTIPEAHYETTMTALKRGCHVLSEKPLADSMQHAEEMIAAARQTEKIFAVIQNRRYDNNIRRFKHFLASGVLGPLTTVNSDFYIGAHFGGFREQMKHVLLLDMAIHSFDAARLLIGADPLSVYCKEWNPAGSWYAHGASAIAIFAMSNGTVYTYRGSWCADGLPTSWNCAWHIVGQQGSATWDGQDTYRAQVIKEAKGFISSYQDIDVPAYESAAIGGHEGLIREFIASIKSGQQPETSALDNKKSLAMVLAAIESADTGQPVAISS